MASRGGVVRLLLTLVLGAASCQKMFDEDDDAVLLGPGATTSWPVSTTDWPEYGSGYNDTDLDYDAELSHEIFNWCELAPALVVYSLTMLLGLAGNSLIIFTTQRYRRMQSTTNVFLSSLASADLLLIVFCIPVKVAKLFSYTWGMGFLLCKMVHYMQNVSAICSVVTLTAMSIERYYAIIHPMRVKYVCSLSQARKICVGIWLAAFILALPILAVQSHMQVGVRHKGYWCVRDWDSPTLWRIHEVYCLVLILVVPTGIMVFTYSVVCWEVWHVMLQRYHMTRGNGLNVESIPLSKKRQVGFRESLRKGAAGQVRMEEETQTVKQVIKMLVAVVVVFVLCWAPLLIDNVLVAFGVLPVQRFGPLRHMNTFFHLLAYFNSCVNPIVYGFMSRSFRESFRQALCRCCRPGRAAARAPSTNTRTTSLRLNDTTSFGRSVSGVSSTY